MIELSDIRKTYRMGEVDVHALRGVSLRIDRGEFVAIVGPSGSGKSTLMHILGLLDVPDGGSYRLDGVEARNLDENALAGLRARTIGFVFQQFNLLARVTALDNVTLPLIYADRAPETTPEEVLDRVGLGDRMGHTPAELSGGQQQRVAIARALVNRPAIVMADEPTGNLDSRSAAEIMGILSDLHRSGLTVILVTHDPEVARNATRTVTVLDGRVSSDRLNDAKPAGAQAAGAAAPRPAGARDARDARGWSWRRKFREADALVRQAARSLGANKTRTLLSMLGVTIGVAAVIGVTALGTGAKRAVEDRISSMGANLLVLMPRNVRTRGVSLGAGAVSRLTVDDAAAIRAEIKEVRAVSSTVRGQAQLTVEGRNWRTTVNGVSPDYAGMHDMTPQAGRFFTEAETQARARVAVIGVKVLEELFAGANPIGRSVRINRVAFEVIGVLPTKGSTFMMDENDQVLVPVTTAMRRLLGRDYVDRIEIQATSAEQAEYLEMAAVALMERRHRVTERDGDDAFQVRNMADIQSAIQSTSQTMSWLLTGIGAISLLVGGIGIMNIMLVSVTERTREIGIRKAVGARRSDVLAQFLVEAMAISAFGGVLGVVLGAAAAFGMSRLAGWSVAITVRTVVGAVAFSAAVGIVFGLWPARKASALEPIRALRYE